MRSKDRVRAAIERRPTDRVPVWMWFHPGMNDRLAALLELPASRVADALGDDVRQTWVGNNYAMEGTVHAHEGGSHTDVWGIEWVREGEFNQIRRSPLEDADDQAIRAYRYPYDRIESLVSNMEPVVAKGGEYFIGCDVSPCLFEMVCRIRGMERATLDLAEAPERARAMLRDASDFAVRLAREACDRFAVDWLWTGDDVAGQLGMIMSPEAWRSLIRPELERIFAIGRSRGLPVAYHCCGSLRPIIPDLVDMGLDVLNPIQAGCPGMDPAELKREFGGDLSFMGGLDTRELLPRGDAEEVYRATSDLIETMADGGGYILAASHAVPPETPLPNVFAIYRAAGVSRDEILDRAADLRVRAAEGADR